MRIAILLGSIRQVRRTEAVARWVHDQATTREGDTHYELVDLAEYELPLLTSPVHPMAAKKKYDDANVQRWSDTIDTFDGTFSPEERHPREVHALLDALEKLTRKAQT